MKLCMGCMEMYEDKFDICPCCGYEENSLPEEAFHLTPGTVIGERYIVGKVLGFGGFGVTYIGFDRELEKKVAIKEYLPSEFATRTLHQTKVTVYGGDKTEQFGLGMAKFVDEARKLAKFNEDTEIVNVYDTFTENDTAYIIMEYLEGESLKQLLERKGKLSLEEAEKIIIPIYRSLKNIHEAGIVHRDIAPDNIFITKEGRVKLLDFGAARYASATHSRSLTVIYKPGYAPEEQYQSRGEQGPWTDVYALSATMYKCITGITPDTSLERKVKDTLKEPSKLGVDISKNKETALMNALNIQVAARTKSTEDFLKEWESKGEVTRILEKIKSVDVGKLSRKAKAGIIAGIIAIAVGIAVVIGLGGVSKITDSIKIAQGNVRVPSVVNEWFDDAITITENAGVHMMQEDTKYDALIEKGKVLTQNVEAGQVMNAEGSLLVVVSGGVRQIYVPEIAGSRQEDAVATLLQEGFSYRLEEEYSAVAIGNVIRTNYSAGTQCDEGAEIVVYVSKGIDPSTIDIPDEDEEPIEYVVEDYSNMTIDEVSAILAQYGIYLDYSEQVESETVAKDCVVSQITAVGTTLTIGDTVKVVMSTGIPMINVGDIIGWQFEDRKMALEEAGLIVEKGDEKYDSNRAAGVILSIKTELGEAITDGTMIKKGTRIICTVSKGAKPTNTPTPTKTPKPTNASKPTSTPKPTVHLHNWNSATCTTAKKCTICGLTDGEAKGHNWNLATCTTAKKCATCGITEGYATGHNWSVATCTTAKECKTCRVTEGVALGHNWKSASCTSAKSCVTCGITEGGPAGHDWSLATCTTAKECKTCRVTEGVALGHNWKQATCTSAKSCVTCGITEGNALGHDWKSATCTTAKTCKACGVTEGNALGHDWKSATCTTAKTCKACGVTEGNVLGHNWKAATCTEAKMCKNCKETAGYANGHKYVDDGNKESCSVCGQTIAVWSEWSDWSTIEVISSATRKVESKTTKVTVTKTKYRYGGYFKTVNGQLVSAKNNWKDGSGTYRYTGWYFSPIECVIKYYEPNVGTTTYYCPNEGMIYYTEHPEPYEVTEEHQQWRYRDKIYK